MNWQDERNVKWIGKGWLERMPATYSLFNLERLESSQSYVVGDIPVARRPGRVILDGDVLRGATSITVCFTDEQDRPEYSS